MQLVRDGKFILKKFCYHKHIYHKIYQPSPWYFWFSKIKHISYCILVNFSPCVKTTPDIVKCPWPPYTDWFSGLISKFKAEIGGQVGGVSCSTRIATPTNDHPPWLPYPRERDRYLYEGTRKIGVHYAPSNTTPTIHMHTYLRTFGCHLFTK